MIGTRRGFNWQSSQAQGLRAVYSFHMERGAKRLVDRVAGLVASHNGTFNAAWRDVAGRQAYTFGGSEYWRIGTAGEEALGGTWPWSVATWFVFSSGNRGAIYAEGRSSNTTPLLAINVNAVSAGRLEAAIRNDGSQILQVYDSGDVLNLNDGLPHHMVVVRPDRDTLRVYVDGVLFGSDSATMSSTYTVDQVTLGTLLRTSASQQITGDSVQEVRIYDKALSVAEIVSLYDPASRWSLYERSSLFFTSYAAPAGPVAQGIRVEVDWDRDGDYDDAHEDITADVIRAKWRLGARKPYQLTADENTASLELKNTDGKYNPENICSPLFGHLKPHTRMRIVDNASNTVLWTGWIEFPTVDWKPSAAYTGKTTAQINGYGGKTLLDRAEVTLPFYEDVTGDVIVTEALAQARVPTGTGTWRLGTVNASELGVTTILGSGEDLGDLETGKTVFPVYGDGQADSAWGIIQDVTQGEQGRFFVARDGTFTWWNRHHLLLETTNTATVKSDAGSYMMESLTYAYGALVANIVRAEANPRTTGASETLWSLDEPISIPPGDVVQIEARLRKSTGQFAGSNSLTATPTFSSGTAIINVRERGGTAQITITNDGSDTAVLSDLTLAGQPTVQQNKLVVEETDNVSIDENGPQSLKLDLGPVTDYDEAFNVARFELNRRATARGDVLDIRWKRKWDGVDNAHMLAWTIGTRINIVLDEIGHDADYFVIGEEHEWKDYQVHRATYHLERASSNQYWVLGAAGASELGSTTRLGY